MSETCYACGQTLWGEKVFEGFMANLLKAAVKACKSQTVRWKVKDGKTVKVMEENMRRIVTQADFLSAGGTAQQYTRLGDLKYWGFLEQKHEWWHYGIYQVSNRALDFISGKVRVPRVMRVHKGRVVGEGEIQVSFSEANKGEWFDIPAWMQSWRSDDRQEELFE